MQVRIFYKPKSAMQSAGSLSGEWILEPVPQEAHSREQVMGWKGSGDTDHMELRLSFPSEAAAIEFAKNEGYAYSITASQIESKTDSKAMKQKKLAKPYASNFASDRRQPWTH